MRFGVPRASRGGLLRRSRRSEPARWRAPSHVRLLTWPGRSGPGVPEGFPAGAGASGRARSDADAEADADVDVGSAGSPARADPPAPPSGEQPRIVVTTNPLPLRTPPEGARLRPRTGSSPEGGHRARPGEVGAVDVVARRSGDRPAVTPAGAGTRQSDDVGAEPAGPRATGLPGGDREEATGADRRVRPAGGTRPGGEHGRVVAFGRDPRATRGGDADGDGDVETDESRADRRRRRRQAAWRAVAAAPRGFQGLVAAVYAALADPLTSGSAEVRARRAARIRRVGTVAASAAVGMVLVYAIFPVRTYLDQRSARQRTQEELEVLTDANDELTERARELREREVVEEIARRDYGLVFPFEEPYAVLPPPVGGTTTTAP